MTAVYYSLQWNTEQYFDISFIRFTFSLPRSTAAEKESLDSWPPSSAFALSVPEAPVAVFKGQRAGGTKRLSSASGGQPLVLLDSAFQCFGLIRFFFDGVRYLASKLLLRVEAGHVD